MSHQLTLGPIPLRPQPAAAELVAAGARAAAAIRSRAAQLSHAERAIVRAHPPSPAIQPQTSSQVQAPFEGAAARAAEVRAFHQHLQSVMCLMRLVQVDVQQCTNSRMRLQKRAQEWDVLKERVVIIHESDDGPMQDAGAIHSGAESAAIALETGNRLQMPLPVANEQSSNVNVEVVNNRENDIGEISVEDDDDEDSYDGVVFEDVL